MVTIRSELISKSNKLFILSGLPGSGKSTIVKDILFQLQILQQHCQVFSYDFYHYENLEFRYDYSLAKERIQQCHNDFVAALVTQTYRIVIDNVNSTFEEIEPYLESLVNSKREYEILFIRTLEQDPKRCYYRCVHGVPFSQIVKMKNRLETIQSISEKIHKNYPTLKIDYLEIL